jgi:DNA polymerase-1
MLLQVHDELVLEAPEANAKMVAEKVKNIMQSVAHLSVPLLVETGVGDDWGSIH